MTTLTLGATEVEAVIQPGEPSPDVALPDHAGTMHHIDDRTTGVQLMLFLMPEDKYTTPTLAAMEEMFAQTPQLTKGLGRWLVLSRMGPDAEVPLRLNGASEGWTLLLDREDRAFRDYRIIATPTVVIVGRDRVVAAVHPGYDPGLVQDVRVELARTLGVELPLAATQTPPPPNMALQMGRRLAARGLWEKALDYYAKAEEQGAVDDEVRLEIVEIHIAMEHFDRARELLDSLKGEPELAERIDKLESTLKEAQEGEPAPAEPPRITR